MTGPEAAEKSGFFLNWRPNRSLDKQGRRLWLAVIMAPVLLVSAGVAWVGAWPVLPFAGLEMLFVWWAFRLVGKHDDDYEMLDVSSHEFCWERRERRRIDRLTGNPAWATLTWHQSGSVQGVYLRYGGRSVMVGTQLCEPERRQLARQLATVFRCQGK